MRALEAVSTALVRTTKLRDLYAVPLEQQQEVVQMVGAALVEAFTLAPSRYRRATVAQRLSGSTTAVTGLSIATGATSTTSGSFGASYRGQSVVLENDQAYNVVTSTTAVLYPYAGTSTCTSATIYEDAFTLFDFSVDRILGEVWCQRASDGRRWTLARDDSSWWCSVAYAGTDPAMANPLATEYRRRTYSYPLTYSLSALGQSRDTATSAGFVLRVDPIPTQAHTIEFEVDQWPEIWTLESIYDGAVLPLPDARAVMHYTDLLCERFTESSLADLPRERADRIARRADRARIYLEDLPQYFAPPVVSIGLGAGF